MNASAPVITHHTLQEFERYWLIWKVFVNALHQKRNPYRLIFTDQVHEARRTFSQAASRSGKAVSQNTAIA